MKITIEVNDLELFAKGFNNAIAAYGDIVWNIKIGCDVPSRFEVLKEVPIDDLIDRHNCLVDAYEQVVKIEQLKETF